MITIRLQGGLGNQMFQYAAAYALARRLGAPLRLDLSCFPGDKLRDYMLDRYNLPAGIEVTSGGGILPVKLRRFLPEKGLYREPHFHVDPWLFNLQNPAILEGYFQSEQYFSACAGDIRAHFTLKDGFSAGSATLKTRIEEAPVSVSLHMRRGDYVSDPKVRAVHGCLTEDYYREAVQIIQEKCGAGVRFFIFSDDPDYAESTFDFCPDKHIVRGNDASPHEDMQLMACCDHHIIANSSFSWWGAWLNDAPGKTVVAPRRWFGPETMKEKNTKDLLPEEWIKI